MTVSRYYSATARATTLTGSVNGAATSLAVAATTGFPVSTPFTLIIDNDTPDEEVVEVTNVAGLTLTVTRGVDGTSGVPHTSGASVRHGVSARDFRESREHEDASVAHGATGAVVGTTNTQTLTNKTLDSPTINGGTIASPTVVTPTIAGFTNAQHNHSNAAGGGKIPMSSVTNLPLFTVPVGAVLPHAGASVPSGWLRCDGQAVSRTTYATLFAAIGTAYGAGDGTTTFNVPNLTDRFPRGSATRGATGGADSATLTTNHLPQHSHSIDHDHPSTSTSSNGDHSHTYGRSTTTGSGSGAAQGSTSNAADGATNTTGAHTHTFDVPAFTGSSGNAGQASPTAVPTVPAYVTVDYIICAGA